MNADVVIKMALDKSGVQDGLRSISGSIGSFASDMKRNLIGALGFGAVVGGIGATIQEMRKLRREAEDFGVSLDFLQTLQALSVKFGESSDDAGAALQKLNVLIGEARQGAGAARDKFSQFGIALTDANGAGLSTQQIFAAIANKYKATGDAADKAALAMDFFGNKGAAINNILGEGSSGIEAYNRHLRAMGLIVNETNAQAIASLGDGFVKLKALLQNLLGLGVRWEQQVQSMKSGMLEFAAEIGAQAKRGMFDLSRFGDIIKNAWNRPAATARDTAANANALANAREQAATEAEIVRLEKELRDAKREGLEDEAKAVELRRELKAISDELATTDDRSVEAKKLEVEQQKKLNQLAEIEKRNAKERINDAEKLLAAVNRFAEAEQREVQAKKTLREAKEDRGKFTLEELATGNPRGVSDPKLREDMLLAQRAFLVEQRATFNRRQRGGSLEEFNRQMDIAGQMRAGISNLTMSERFPFRSMEEGIRDAAANTAAMLAFFNGGGVPAKVVNAD